MDKSLHEANLHVRDYPLSAVTEPLMSPFRFGLLFDKRGSIRLRFHDLKAKGCNFLLGKVRC
jgi:hypothetical protein